MYLRNTPNLIMKTSGYNIMFQTTLFIQHEMQYHKTLSNYNRKSYTFLKHFPLHFKYENLSKVTIGLNALQTFRSIVSLSLTGMIIHVYTKTVINLLIA